MRVTVAKKYKAEKGKIGTAILNKLVKINLYQNMRSEQKNKGFEGLETASI